MNKIYFGDNLQILRQLEDESVDLMYIDPPFNTGKTQRITPIQTIKDENGDRVGFQGNKYRTIKLDSKSYNDSFNHNPKNEVSEEIYNSYQEIAPWCNVYYLEVFLKPRLLEAHRLLKEHGSLYFHIDYREVHYCKILLDKIFGRDNFINEIIWAYDFGGRSRSRWPAKHDNILLYVKNKEKYLFDQNAVKKIDYMAPGLVGKDKANRGKVPTDSWFWPYLKEKFHITDTWWMSIIGTNSKERTGYPTQKPLGLITRIIEASSLKNYTVLDFFAGSGTVGESCLLENRNFILIDKNIDAVQVMAERFAGIENIEWINFDPKPYQETEGDLSRILRKEEPENHHIEEEIPSEEFKFLALTSTELQKGLEENDDKWQYSPFEWITHLPARSKGKIARQLLTKWLLWKDIKITRINTSGETIKIKNKEYAMKFSTLWKSGIYRFQQIKKVGPEYIICFGLSPLKAHCWIIDRDSAITHGNPQHKGATNSEYWLSINPNNLPDWLDKYGGDFETAISILKNS